MQNADSNNTSNSDKIKYSYEFNNINLFTSIGKTPKVANVKNDFSIWGNRRSVSGQDLPIHVRYAICKKPKQYKEYEDTDYDWRELIYQMAKDYYDPNIEDKIQTGYEQYYSDFI
jgi:hypothetical protein